MIKDINYPIKYDVGENIDPLHYFNNEYKEIPFTKTFAGISIKKLYKFWDSKYKKEYLTETYKKTRKKNLVVAYFFWKMAL